MNDGQVAAIEALERLRQGNARFVDGDRCIDTYLSHTRIDAHIGGQAPFAVVLGCSDSRVPVEIIFDVGLGDLFVVRVAGNIVAPSLIGSIELAAERFGPRLVVVLGHTGCGAVDAAISAVQTSANASSGSVNDIVERIRPSIAAVLADGDAGDRDALMRDSVRANVRNSVAELRQGSEMLERLIRDEGLKIVGAEYSLETGLVHFFDDATDTG